MIKVKKIKTEYRAVEFDASAGSDSLAEVDVLFDWAGVWRTGVINSVGDYMPSIDFPAKKPTYPGEMRNVVVRHGEWIVASSRGKVKVMTDNEYSEKFEEKE